MLTIALACEESFYHCPSLRIDSLGRLAGWTLLPQPSFSACLSLPFPMLCLSCPVLLFPFSNRTLYLSSELLPFTIALGSRPALMSGIYVCSTSFLLQQLLLHLPFSSGESFLDLHWEQLIKATLCPGCSCLARLCFWLSSFCF